VLSASGRAFIWGLARRDLGIGSKDRLTNVNPIYFDNSVFDIYAALLNGAALCVDALKVEQPADLVADIHQNECTFVSRYRRSLCTRLHAVLIPGEIAKRTRFMFRGEGFPDRQTPPLLRRQRQQSATHQLLTETETSWHLQRIRVTAAYSIQRRASTAGPAQSELRHVFWTKS